MLVLFYFSCFSIYLFRLYYTAFLAGRLAKKVIEDPDDISLEGDYFGRPVIHFVKDIDGKTTVVTYDSDKTFDIRIQTAYKGKKKSLATATSEQADVNTPEATSGTALNDNIPQPDEFGKHSKQAKPSKDGSFKLYYTAFLAGRLAKLFSVDDLEVVYKLYSTKAKNQQNQSMGASNNTLPISASADTITVAQLLDAVNRTYPDTLSDDVLVILYGISGGSFNCV